MARPKASSTDYLPELVDELVHKGLYPSRKEAQAALNTNRVEIEEAVKVGRAMLGPMYDNMVIVWKRRV